MIRHTPSWRKLRSHRTAAAAAAQLQATLDAADFNPPIPGKEEETLGPSSLAELLDTHDVLGHGGTNVELGVALAMNVANVDEHR